MPANMPSAWPHPGTRIGAATGTTDHQAVRGPQRPSGASRLMARRRIVGQARTGCTCPVLHRTQGRRHSGTARTHHGPLIQSPASYRHGGHTMEGDCEVDSLAEAYSIRLQEPKPSPGTRPSSRLSPDGILRVKRRSCRQVLSCLQVIT